MRICKIFKAMTFVAAAILRFITRLLKKLNDILEFSYLVKPLIEKFLNLITGKMKSLLRIKRCNSNFRMEILTRNGMANRLEYGVQTSSCHASSFFISADKNTALKNPVERYFLNKTIVNKSFLIKLNTKYAADICLYRNCEENATEFVLRVF